MFKLQQMSINRLWIQAQVNTREKDIFTSIAFFHMGLPNNVLW